MQKILNRFQRITSSGSYIPEVDGLRFLAIISVVMYHIRGAFIDYVENHQHYSTKLEDSKVYPLLENGHQGVEIFFAISGFILAYPFVRHYRYNGKSISLKDFYLRRVTRLEPPYILSLCMLFVIALVVRNISFSSLLPNFLASLFYVHNILYDGLPRVSAVTWSLEVEVQFYLLTPLLMRIFVLPKTFTRGLLTAIIIAMPFFQNFFVTQTNWLYKFFQYFAVGILLADLYLDKTSILHKANTKFISIAGVVALVLLLSVDGHVSANLSSYAAYGKTFFQKLLFPFLILAFFIIVMGNNLWKHLFSYKLITVIGGMCYSIYLLHRTVMSLFDKWIYNTVHSGNILLDYVTSFIILSVCIVIVSSIFFILVEKPCMEKNWYKRIFSKRRAELL